MKTRDLHDWNVGYADAVLLQERIRKRILLRDRKTRRGVRLVAGADVSYARGSDLFYAAVVLLSFPEMEVLSSAWHRARVHFPYIPGLLSFREGPPLLAAFAKLATPPDVVFFDGQGIAHPRGVGLASHIGLWLDVPSIGCAKTRLVGTHAPVGQRAGDASPLVVEGRVVGAALRTKDRVKPVFVSPGHRICLETAISLTLTCCRGYRIPEPVRQAHLLVNRLRIEDRDSPRQPEEGGFQNSVARARR